MAISVPVNMYPRLCRPQLQKYQLCCGIHFHALGQLALRTEGEKFTCTETLPQLTGKGQERSGFHGLQVELRVKLGAGEHTAG